MLHVDLKIVLLGQENVGKTCIMQRYVNDRFIETSKPQNTIGCAVCTKTLNVNDKKLVLSVWDTGGTERYYAMTKSFYRNAAAAIVCYDVTDPITYDRAKFWINELRSVEENCKIYLCGTKIDLISDTQKENPPLNKVLTYVNGVQIKFFQTSSKTGKNIEKIFDEIIQDYLKNPISSGRNGSTINLNHKRQDDVKSNRCCRFL